MSTKFTRAPDWLKLLKTADRTKKTMVAPWLDLTQCRDTRTADEPRTPGVQGHTE